MTVEPKSEKLTDEMTLEEARTALALIRALEVQVRNLEKQIAVINEQAGRQPKAGDRSSDDAPKGN